MGVVGDISAKCVLTNTSIHRHILWYMVYGIWYMVCGMWYMVYGVYMYIDIYIYTYIYIYIWGIRSIIYGVYGIHIK